MKYDTKIGNPFFTRKKRKHGIIVVSVGHPKTHNEIDFVGEDNGKPKYYVLIHDEIFEAGNTGLEEEQHQRKKIENQKPNFKA